jgi:hypothetical protein
MVIYILQIDCTFFANSQMPRIHQRTRKSTYKHYRMYVALSRRIQHNMRLNKEDEFIDEGH